MGTHMVLFCSKCKSDNHDFFCQLHFQASKTATFPQEVCVLALAPTTCLVYVTAVAHSFQCVQGYVPSDRILNCAYMHFWCLDYQKWHVCDQIGTLR